ncbi:MAG: glycosyltransferase family 39 protein [Bacteroidia bacterium]|nr:glycosyltransferase family 39 protein [Bacteroidia bacterium]
MFKTIKRHIPFWLIVFSTIMLLIVAQLVQDGMFMDGMLYVSVSKNLANGIGTFWHPHFSKTAMTNFHEQPPLYFGLLAIFYKILGTSFYVERFFCLITLCVTGYFIKKIWEILFISDLQNKQQSWLPVLLWITIPVCFWSYANHTEETVMSVFTVSTVYFISKALILKQKISFNLLLAGVFIFLSSLTKGPQGLFPIAAIGLFWIANIKDFSFKKCILYSILLTLPSLLIYSGLISNPVIYKSFEMYFAKRFVSTFNNIGATTDNHFEILFRLFSELIPALIITALLLFYGKVKNITNNPKLKVSLWFLLIGLSGSLPLMITLEQRGFYLTTTFPFFAISFGTIITGTVSSLINKTNTGSKQFTIFKYCCWILFIGSSTYAITQIGNFKRDRELLSDIYLINKIIPNGEIISCPTSMWNEWSVHTYFNRYNYISLESIENKRHKFLISYKEISDTSFFYRYNKTALNTQKLDLYQLK